MNPRGFSRLFRLRVESASQWGIPLFGQAFNGPELRSAKRLHNAQRKYANRILMRQ